MIMMIMMSMVQVRRDEARKGKTRAHVRGVFLQRCNHVRYYYMPGQVRCTPDAASSRARPAPSSSSTARPTTIREFKDVLFEDVVFEDKNKIVNNDSIITYTKV